MILHTWGSHSGYAQNPLFNYLETLLNLQRNHYDRVVHFLFGVVFYFPIYEFLKIKLKVKGFWLYFLPILIIAGLKGIFEAIEYGYVYFTESDLFKSEYLGWQGDQWDAQKDLILGFIGSIISSIIQLARNKN